MRRSSQMMNRRAAEGFSLIEILVVIIVAGVLALVAWPALAKLAPKYRLEGAARTVAAEIQRARGRAIGEGKCAIVSLSRSAKTYQLGVITSSACPTNISGYSSGSLEAARAIEDTGSITIEDANSLGNDPVAPVFNSRGLTEVASSIRLANNLGDARLVVVNTAGHVQIQ